MNLTHPSLLFCSALWACQSKENPEDATNTDTAIEENIQTGSIPLFIVAGQSNAEGNVRLRGLEALQNALPLHNEPLTEEERESLRAAYTIGIGDWCNPEEDYDVNIADSTIDTFRASGLDISAVSSTFTIEESQMIAYRWSHQEANIELGEPYENPASDAHLAQKTILSPMSVGFGVWDNEDTEALFYGPELGFALRIQQESYLDNFYIMKVAMGGSSLYEHWAPNGPMREQLYEKTNNFLSSNDAYVAGLIWFQGFNDQFEEEFRASYKDNLDQLISDFRQSYGSNVPVVVIQARKVHDLSIIADMQAQVVSETDNTVLVESDGLTNCFHYDSASQLIIGDRSAEALIPIMR